MRRPSPPRPPEAGRAADEPRICCFVQLPGPRRAQELHIRTLARFPAARHGECVWASPWTAVDHLRLACAIGPARVTLSCSGSVYGARSRHTRPAQRHSWARNGTVLQPVRTVYGPTSTTTPAGGVPTPGVPNA